jgi:protease-4
MADENQAAETEGPAQDASVQNWERDLIARIAFASLSEQRKARRWGIFFKLLVFTYLFLVLWIATVPSEWLEGGLSSGRHSALVEVEGLIAAGEAASAENVVESLRDAFEDGKTKGVIVQINSPGGSAVQAGLINQEIRRLRAKYPDIPAYAVITDLCASGGYYIAVAADAIYADEASIVGSIVVVMAGFGFVEAIDELGIERRIQTAGEHKAMFDPFSPVDDFAHQHIQGMLNKIHAQFIDVVKAGRAEKLALNESVFSGLIWTGKEAVELGLVDAIGSADHVAREVIGAEEVVDFTQKPDLWKRIADRVGAAMGRGLGAAIGVGMDAGMATLR